MYTATYHENREVSPERGETALAVLSRDAEQKVQKEVVNP